jgi:hypothetical protein
MTAMGRKLKVRARSCKSTPPPWAVNLGYDLFMWMEHHLACKIKPIGFIWPASSSYSGGCYRKSSDWEDPPTGPTNDYRKRVTMGVFNWTWIFFSHLQKLRKNPKVFNCSIWTLSRKYRLKINGKWVLLHPT